MPRTSLYIQLLYINFFNIYLFSYAGSYLWHVVSSSLIRNQTQVPGALHWEAGVLAGQAGGDHIKPSGKDVYLCTKATEVPKEI